MRVAMDWFVDGLRRSPGFDAYVLVDVLRFSTTLAAALSLGVKAVYVLDDYSKAREAAGRLGLPLMAEINARKPEWADLDNSPSELFELAKKAGMPEAIVAVSTSGAKIIAEALRQGLPNALIGSTVNAGGVAAALNRIGAKSVAIIGAGYHASMVAVEDVLGAGAIISEISRFERPLLDDSALIAMELFARSRESLLELMLSGSSAGDLRELHKEGDVELASRVNSLSAVPALDPASKALKPFNGAGGIW